jgi:flagellar protein FlbT
MRSMSVSLRAGERMYMNGAVFKVNRKVSIEILNDVSFLLEAHVMQPEDTKTPLRQLYFVIQTMMIDPDKLEQARGYFDTQLSVLLCSYADLDIIHCLCHVKILVPAGRYYEALKQVRHLFPLEDAILGELEKETKPEPGSGEAQVAHILTRARQQPGMRQANGAKPARVAELSAK